jgi:hypothetical protein
MYSPKFTPEECKILMKIIKIRATDFDTNVEIPNFHGYGISTVINTVDSNDRVTPKISLAALKTGYYSTFENVDVCETEIVIHKILGDIEYDLEYYKNQTKTEQISDTPQAM